MVGICEENVNVNNIKSEDGDIKEATPASEKTYYIGDTRLGFIKEG